MKSAGEARRIRRPEKGRIENAECKMSEHRRDGGGVDGWMSLFVVFCRDLSLFVVVFRRAPRGNVRV